MKWISLLLWLALARVPQQGELVCRAVLGPDQGAPVLTFTLQSRSREALSMVLPAGTPMCTAEGNTVYLLSQLNVQLKPGDQAQVSLPVVAQGKVHGGEYEPSEDHSLNHCALRVREVVSQNGGAEAARLALLRPDKLTPEQTAALARFQLTPWRMLTPLKMKGTPGYRISLRNGTLELDLPEIACAKPSFWTSGTLKATLWASSLPGLENDRVVGHRLGEFDLQSINGGGVWPARTVSCALRRPPGGTYYTVFTIEEYTGPDWTVTLWAPFEGQVNL